MKSATFIALCGILPFLAHADASETDGWCGDISPYTGLENRFVSEGGTWGANDQKYTKIEDALTAAKAGDVIWIHDGFVCKPDSADDYLGSHSFNSQKRHFDVTKDVTLRSVAGDARGHENPPILQGRFHDEEGAATNPCKDTWIGGDSETSYSIRAVRATTGTFKGIVIEHSAHGGWHPSYADSAIYGGGYTLDKCIIRDCHSRTSMMRGQIVITDCVISNNTGSSITGGSQMTISGTYFENNAGTVVNLTATTDVGSIVTNCVFNGNSSDNGGAMHSDGPVLVTDCLFTNNVASCRGGAYYGYGTITNCIFRCNVLYKTNANYNHGGGAVAGEDASKCFLYDCTVVSNGIYYGSKPGGGVYGVTAYRTPITDNYAKNAEGGGAANSVLYDCQILRNETVNKASTPGSRGGGIYGGSATRCVIAGNVAVEHAHPTGGDGGGAYEANLYNCVITNNTSCSSYSERGGAVCFVTAGHEMINCLVADNHEKRIGVAGVSAGGDYANRMINCTVVDNTTDDARSYGGVFKMSVVNSIVWNCGGQSPLFAAATNSCATVLTDTSKYPGCITANPMFIGVGEYPYSIMQSSPCMDAGLYDKDDPQWSWMTDASHPCSTALNNVRRITGEYPDMGCYECRSVGVLMLFW